jgi:hypothetical protein
MPLKKLKLSLSVAQPKVDEAEEEKKKQAFLDKFDKEGPANLSDDCEKIRVLGCGTSGIVYLGIYIPTMQVVAVKEMRVAQDHRESMAKELHELHRELVPICKW